MSAPVRERIVRFGPSQGLAGIVTLPREARKDVPPFVLVNAGIVHRIGPNRLYVDIARRLAACGYPVLRFDLSGLGDSESLTGGASLTESALADIKSALDFLETSRKVQSFVVVGLCSGANYGMAAAFVDARIMGTVLIDPTVGRTRRSELVHLARRLRHGATWGALLTLRHPVFLRSFGRLRSMAIVDAAQGLSAQRAPREAVPASEAEVRASLTRVLDRGAQLMMVFTGGVNHIYNYRQQLFDLMPGFDFRDQLRLEFMPETDHTVSDGPSRAKLLTAIADWSKTCFPGVAPTGGAA